MAFSDWDFFKTGSATESLQPTGFILGASSLEVICNGSDEWQGQLDAGQTRGFTVGKVRTLMKAVSVTGTLSQVYPGLFCMSESEDVTAINQDLYMVAVNPNNVADNIELKRLINSIDQFNTATTLASAQIDFTVGNTIGLELEWQLDLVNIGGIALRVRTGTQTDFSDLSLRFTYIDPSPLTTSFAEGLALYTNSGSGDVTMLFDETAIFEGSN
jgi:hypothetical protein